MADEETLIGSFDKNKREEVRVTLSNYRGTDLINVRAWFKAEGDEMRPGRSGIALRVELLPQLLWLLTEARSAAIEQGVLEDG